MGILRDLVWQFIAVIVALIGILVALIALLNPFIAAIVFIVTIIVLAMFYPKLRPVKTIFFRVISDTTVLSIKEEEEVKNKVKILYEENEVKEDIHLVILRLWNASSAPILTEDYKVDAIKFKFGKEAKILSVHVLESNPPTIKEEIDDSIKEGNEDKKLLKHKAGNVTLKPIWLNKDNSLTLKVLLTIFQDVSTDETRIIVGGYVGDWNKSYYSKIKNLIDRRVCQVVCVNSFGSHLKRG